jgi:hypothetical protein
VLTAVADLASNADQTDTTSFPPVMIDPPAALTPAPDVPSALPADVDPQRVNEPIAVRSAYEPIVATLHSVPMDGKRRWLPAPPGPVTVDPGAEYRASELDRLPSLANEASAARLLAAAYVPREGLRNMSRPDTAVLWLRIGRGGRVTSSQVIFSSSPDAADAALSVAPYLTYIPGEKGGETVPAWISQRLVVLP